jgi:hypothetical protein
MDRQNDGNKIYRNWVLIIEERFKKKVKGAEDRLHCNGSPHNAQSPSAERMAVYQERCSEHLTQWLKRRSPGTSEKSTYELDRV